MVIEMSYYIVITTNADQFEFVRINGDIKQFHRDDEALDSLKRTIETHGSDNVMLLESVSVRVTTDIKIKNKDGNYD